MVSMERSTLTEASEHGQGGGGWDWKGSSYPPGGIEVHESEAGEGVGEVEIARA